MLFCGVLGPVVVLLHLYQPSFLHISLEVHPLPFCHFPRLQAADWILGPFVSFSKLVDVFVPLSYCDNLWGDLSFSLLVLVLLPPQWDPGETLLLELSSALLSCNVPTPVFFVFFVSLALFPSCCCTVAFQLLFADFLTIALLSCLVDGLAVVGGLDGVLPAISGLVGECLPLPLRFNLEAVVPGLLVGG